MIESDPEVTGRQGEQEFPRLSRAHHQRLKTGVLEDTPLKGSVLKALDGGWPSRPGLWREVLPDKSWVPTISSGNLICWQALSSCQRKNRPAGTLKSSLSIGPAVRTPGCPMEEDLRLVPQEISFPVTGSDGFLWSDPVTGGRRPRRSFVGFANPQTQPRLPSWQTFPPPRLTVGVLEDTGGNPCLPGRSVAVEFPLGKLLVITMGCGGVLSIHELTVSHDFV